MNANFNGNMLMLARQLRRVGQEDLVTQLQGAVTQSTLSKIERGRIQPDGDVVALLADALKVSPAFFRNPSYLRQPPVSFHRKRKALAAKDEVSIHARSEVYRLGLKDLLLDIELEPQILPPPAIDLDQYSGDATEVARVARKRWGLPRGPVADMTGLLEDAGIVVVPFNFGTELIDGFCQHGGDGLPPIIFINTTMPKDRMRFSLAHELGHLIMHDMPNPEQEIQADRFASEFLMPEMDIREDLYDLKLTKFMELKLHWGTSMAAIIIRAWQLGRLDDRRYKYFFIEMSKRGWRKDEPVSVQHLKEMPSTVKAIVSAHIDQLGRSEEELADQIGLRVDEFRDWFSLYRKRQPLRLVRP